jgi:conjugative transfer region protein (TIGR03750 family)
MADKETSLTTDVVAPLTDRANSEPAILRGLTSTETSIAAIIAFVFWAFLGVLVALISKIWAIGVLIASLAPMLTVWVLAGWLASVKRDRPDSFYVHKFWEWRAKSGLAKSPFITHKGYWDIGREFDVARTKRKRKKAAA